jgi:hypothetical protein
VLPEINTGLAFIVPWRSRLSYRWRQPLHPRATWWPKLELIDEAFPQ